MRKALMGYIPGIPSLGNKYEDVKVNSLADTFKDKIRPFIDTIDALRWSGLQQDINLPNLVIVGDQSSGKSSIIEAISGIQLPRGKGMVTRCPLELQLMKTASGPWIATVMYKKMDHTEVILETKNPCEVETFIRNAQEDICGPNKGVSDQLITLRVESSADNAPDLTLIDLPGIVRTKLNDQPSDIVEKIRKIIMSYISNVNTVILSVISANQDIGVNESLNIAQQVDPHGLRTIGVVTKPDAADDGQKEEIISLMDNNRIYLKKGFVMIKCRSQDELIQNISLKKALEIEKLFFENDFHFKKLNKSVLGISNLSAKITEELVNIIKKTLPYLTEEIANLLYCEQDKLQRLPRAIPENEPDKLAYLNEHIFKLKTELEQFLKQGKTKITEINYFYDWRKIFEKFRENIENRKKRAMEQNFSYYHLTKEIHQKRGNEIDGFLNFELFENLIANHIETYKPEATNVLKLISKSVQEAILLIISDFFKHLPLIEEDLKAISASYIEMAVENAVGRIDFIFEGEKLVFTMDWVFQNEMNKNLEEENKNSQNLLNKQSFCNANEMSRLINCYLSIVHNRLTDTILIAIRQCVNIDLIHDFAEYLSNYCFSSGIMNKIKENGGLYEERKHLTNRINRLKDAKIKISKL